MKSKLVMKKSPKMVPSSIIKPRQLNAHGGLIDEDIDDAHMLSENSNKKELYDSDWTGGPTIKQSQKASPTKLSRPHVKGENDFENEDSPSGYGKKPPKSMNELDADSSGPAVPDMEKQRNNKKPPYKSSIENQYNEDEASSDMKRAKYAKGGKVSLEMGKGPEFDNLDEPSDLEKDNDRMRLPEDEYMDNQHMSPMLADGGEVDDDGSSPANRPVTMGGSKGKIKSMGLDIFSKAAGGMIDSDEQPQPEAEQEHHDSIAAAIMAKRGLQKLADGGQVDLKENNQMEHPNKYYNQNEDHALDWVAGDEMPDQPHESNEKGHKLSDEDSHDHIDEMRRRMKAKKQF